jgi:hypothetical protein
MTSAGASSAASPLAALVSVFAVATCLLVALMVLTGSLAIRHRLRRRKGVYSKVLESDLASRISATLTIGDLLMEPELRDPTASYIKRLASTRASSGPSSAPNVVAPG